MPAPQYRFRARHVKSGEPAVLVNTPTLFTLDEAARALALVYRDRTRAVSGVNALQQGLSAAAADRVLDRLGSSFADEGLVAHYWQALVSAGVFDQG